MKYLIAIFLLSLTGCITVEGIPITQFRIPYITESIIVDGKTYYAGACSVRVITDKKTLGSVRDHVGGLGECNGVWGITSDEYAKTRVYIQEGK